MVTTRAVAPSEAVSWTGHFSPPASGSYRVMADLTR